MTAASIPEEPKATVARRALQIGLAAIETHDAALRIDSRLRVHVLSDHEDE